MARLAKALVSFISIAIFVTDVAVGTNYTVGGSEWGFSIDCRVWAKSLTFHTGDFLIFKYDDTQHDVAEVTEANYHTCNITKPIYYDITGHTVIQLTQPGTRYFICTVPLHCMMSGMKLKIKVVSNSTTSSPHITSITKSPVVIPSFTDTTFNAGPSNSTTSSRNITLLSATKPPVVIPSFTDTTFNAGPSNSTTSSPNITLPSASKPPVVVPSFADTTFFADPTNTPSGLRAPTDTIAPGAKSETTFNPKVISPAPASWSYDSFDSLVPADEPEPSAVRKVRVGRFMFVFVGLLMLVVVC